MWNRLLTFHNSKETFKLSFYDILQWINRFFLPFFLSFFVVCLFSFCVSEISFFLFILYCFYVMVYPNRALHIMWFPCPNCRVSLSAWQGIWDLLAWQHASSSNPGVRETAPRVQGRLWQLLQPLRASASPQLGEARWRPLPWRLGQEGQLWGWDAQDQRGWPQHHLHPGRRPPAWTGPGRRPRRHRQLPECHYAHACHFVKGA